MAVPTAPFWSWAIVRFVDGTGSLYSAGCVLWGVLMLLLQRTLERQKQRGDANDESAEKRAVPQWEVHSPMEVEVKIYRPQSQRTSPGGCFGHSEWLLRTSGGSRLRGEKTVLRPPCPAAGQGRVPGRLLPCTKEFKQAFDQTVLEAYQMGAAAERGTRPVRPGDGRRWACRRGRNICMKRKDRLIGRGALPDYGPSLPQCWRRSPLRQRSAIPLR